MSTNVGRQSGQFFNTPIKLRSISGLHTTIRLTFIIERISREIYGIAARRLIREDQVAGEAKRQELWYVLQEWEREMDSSPLRLDLSKNLTSVPASVTNYVVCTLGFEIPEYIPKKRRLCGMRRSCFIARSSPAGHQIQAHRSPRQAH